MESQPPNRKGHDMNTTTGIRPLWSIASEALDDPTLKGSARVYATPYLTALQNCWVRTDQYYADSADSLIRYALSNLSTWRGETARQLKADLKAHLSE